MLSQGMLVLLAVLSGISFSLIGIALRLGSDRNLHPLHIVAVSSLMGLVVFGVQSPPVFGEGIPARVIVLGVVAGISQYAVIHMVRVALDLGPLSPLWCAMMLGFVPVVLYAGWYRGEGVTVPQYGAVVMAVVCVLVASLGRKDPTDVVDIHTGRRLRRWWLYGLVLLGVLITNSLANMCIKDLGMIFHPAGGTYWTRSGTVFFVVLYFCVHVGAMTDIVVSKRRPPSVHWMFLLGILAGVGSVSGLWLLGTCIELPAAVLFTVNSVSSILFTAFVGTLFFKEQRTLNWYATIGCAILVVVLTYYSEVVSVILRKTGGAE